MKLTFIHDFPAQYSQINREYYSAGFNYKIWQRYLSVFDSMIIVSRVVQNVSTQNKNISSGERVRFKPIEKYKSIPSLLLHSKEIRSQIEEVIKESEAILIRVPSVLGFIAADVCRKLRKPYMVEVVGAAFDAYWYYGNMKGKMLAPIIEKLQQKTVRHASVAIYVTSNYLQSKYKTDGKAFNCISNVEIFENDIDGKINNPDSEDKVKIGLVGSTYTKYKGHITALKALEILKKKYGESLQMEFVGQGLSKRISQFIEKHNLKDNVLYRGVIYDRELLDDWYKSLTLYIQPSLTEGHCRSIVEAISKGVPTLASSVGGNEDSVSRKYLFKAENSRELASLIDMLLNDKREKEKNIKQNTTNILRYDKNKVQVMREEALKDFKLKLEDK